MRVAYRRAAWQARGVGGAVEVAFGKASCATLTAEKALWLASGTPRLLAQRADAAKQRIALFAPGGAGAQGACGSPAKAAPVLPHAPATHAHAQLAAAAPPLTRHRRLGCQGCTLCSVLGHSASRPCPCWCSARRMRHTGTPPAAWLRPPTRHSQAGGTSHRRHHSANTLHSRRPAWVAVERGPEPHAQATPLGDSAWPAAASCCQQQASCTHLARTAGTPRVAQRS